MSPRHPASSSSELPALVAAAMASAADAHLPALKALVRAEAADLPGVYRMLGADGEVIYVGKAKKVRTRLLSYFRCVYPDDKGARILRDSCHIEWEYTPSEFGALLLELRLIKRWRPRYNVLMKRDARHWSFIKLTRGPAPKLHVVRGSTGSADGGVYYGPFRGAQGVTDAVRELSDAFGLRDCAQGTPMRFADQGELFVPELVQIASRSPRCIRHEIRKCLGPCVAGCTSREYGARVRLAKRFLEGTDDGPLADMREQMDALSEAMEFERAAALRDKMYRLEALQAQFERLRFAVETLSFAYVVPGHAAEDRVYLVRRGRVRAELARPHGAEDAAGLCDLARDVFVPRERTGAAVPTHEVDELLLLSWWFRHRPDELARTVPPDALLQASDDATLAARLYEARRATAPTDDASSRAADAA
ncbi:MAG: UvrB/UvrC motif-containing protein [Gemmatirosa sp.]